MGDVSVTSSLVGAGGSSQVDAASGVVGGGVVGDEVETRWANIANFTERGGRLGSWGLRIALVDVENDIGLGGGGRGEGGGGGARPRPC